MIDQNLVWIDLETTGLNPERCEILEIAVIVTDADLNTISEEKSYVIKNSIETLSNMNSWCLKQHTINNLIDDCLKSKLTLYDVEESICSLLKEFIIPNFNPMCGNSINFDKAFLEMHMPTLNNLFSFRTIDVSSIQQLFTRWHNHNGYVKKGTHRALDDIKESINELKFYRENFFK